MFPLKVDRGPCIQPIHKFQYLSVPANHQAFGFRRLPIVTVFQADNLRVDSNAFEKAL